MGKILSFAEYVDLRVTENAAKLHLKGSTLVFERGGKREEIELTEEESGNVPALSQRVQETLQRLGAKEVHSLDEEFGKAIMSPGTSGEPKGKSWLAVTLHKLFRRQTSHKSVFSVIMGDADDSNNKIRNK